MIVKAKSCLLHRNKATAHTGAGGVGDPHRALHARRKPTAPFFWTGTFFVFCILYFFYRKVEPIDCKPGKNKQGDILGLDHGSFWKTCSQLWALPEEGCDIKGRDSRQFSQGSECVLEGATSVFQLQVAFLSTPRHCSHLWLSLYPKLVTYPLQARGAEGQTPGPILSVANAYQTLLSSI